MSWLLAQHHLPPAGRLLANFRAHPWSVVSSRAESPDRDARPRVLHLMIRTRRREVCWWPPRTSGGAPGNARLLGRIGLHDQARGAGEWIAIWDRWRMARPGGYPLGFLKFWRRRCWIAIEITVERAKEEMQRRVKTCRALFRK